MFVKKIRNIIILAIFCLMVQPVLAVENDKGKMALRIADIPDHASDTVAELRRIRDRLREVGQVDHLESNWQEFRSTVDTLKDMVHQQIRQSASIDFIGGYARQLPEFLVIVERGSQEVDQRIQLLDGDRLLIEKRQAFWQQVQMDFRGQLPDTLNRSIDKIEIALSSALADVADQLQNILSVRTLLAIEREQLISVIEDLKRIRSQRYNSLMHARSMPIWNMRSRSERSFGSSTEIGKNSEFDRVLSSVGFFWRLYQERVLVHVVLFLVTLLVFFGLRRRLLPDHGSDKMKVASDSDENHESGVSRHVIEHPLAISLFFALLAAEVVYPAAPQYILDLCGLFAMFPLLFLVRTIVMKPFRKLTRVLLAIFVVLHVSRVFLLGPLIERLMALAISSALLALVVTAYRTLKKHRHELKSLVATGSAYILWLAAAAMVAAVVTNFIGAFEIAILLNSVTVLSALGFLVTGLAVLLFDELWRLLLLSSMARTLNSVNNYYRLFCERGSKFSRIVGAVIWVYYVISLVEYIAPDATAIYSFFNNQWRIGSIRISLLSVILAVGMIVMSIWVSRFVRFVLDQEIYPRIHLGRGVPKSISFLLHYSILAIGFIFGLGAAGIELSKITVIIGALSVGIGFGLQDSVKNFVSGLILVFERPINIGDVVEVGSLLGQMTRVGARSSTIRTYEGSEVIVPNSNLISDQVINWTLSDQTRRIEVQVGVAYGTDIDAAMAILKNVAASHTDILDVPVPVALFREFGDSSLKLTLWGWTNQYERWIRIQSELTMGINVAFREAGIVIPFPQRDLYIKDASAVESLLDRKNGPAQKSPRKSSRAKRPPEASA